MPCSSVLTIKSRSAAFRHFITACVTCLALTPLLTPAAEAPLTPESWRGAIDQLTQADADRPPAPDGVVFVGSSSIVLWKTLAQDFPGIATINRGFGGSELADSVYYADRIVAAYRPKVVVLYAGENDIARGKSPETVLADFKAFRSLVHAALPQTTILYLAMKESPSREKVRAQMRTANALIAADCATDPRCRFVDVATPMLTPDGAFRPELFQEDRLHLSVEGYALWTHVLTPHLKSALQ